MHQLAHFTIYWTRVIQPHKLMYDVQQAYYFKDVQQVHYITLQHLTIMTHLVNEHLSMIRVESNGCSDDWIMREHKRRLTAWLNDLDLPDGDTIHEQTIKRLAAGTSSKITSWQGYDISGYLFYIIV